MTNVWEREDGGGLIAAAKDAPEAAVDLCGLAPDERARLAGAVDEMAGQGIRVLGVARAELPHVTALPPMPRGLPFRFLGLVGLADPLRPTVPAAVRECRSAGIRVVMITGDYPETARAIAEQAGLDGGDIVSGAEIDRMSDAELALRARGTTVLCERCPSRNCASSRRSRPTAKSLR